MDALPPPSINRSWRPIGIVIGLLAGVTAIYIAQAYRGAALWRRSASRLAQQEALLEAVRRRAASGASGWQLEKRVPVPLAQAIALAAAGQRICVGGGDKDGRGTLLILSLAGEQITRLGLPELPRAMAFADETQNLLVAFADKIARLTLEGRWLDEFAVGNERTRLTSLMPVGEEIWAADSGQRIVWRIRRDGKPIARYGRRNDVAGYPGLIVPSPHLDLARAPTGEIIVNNPGQLRVEVWTKEGRVLRHFGRPGLQPESFCGCCNPIAIAALPDGRIVTAEKGLVRVKLYRPDGSWEGLVAERPLLSANASFLDIAVTPSGTILVLDPWTRTILFFQEQKAGARKANAGGAMEPRP